MGPCTTTFKRDATRLAPPSIFTTDIVPFPAESPVDHTARTAGRAGERSGNAMLDCEQRAASTGRRLSLLFHLRRRGDYSQVALNALPMGILSEARGQMHQTAQARPKNAQARLRPRSAPAQPSLPTPSPSAQLPTDVPVDTPRSSQRDLSGFVDETVARAQLSRRPASPTMPV